MKGVRNLWVCKQGNKTATLEREGRLWYVRVKAGDQVLTEQSFKTIAHAQEAYDRAADSVANLTVRE